MMDHHNFRVLPSNQKHVSFRVSFNTFAAVNCTWVNCLWWSECTVFDNELLRLYWSNIKHTIQCGWKDVLLIIRKITWDYYWLWFRVLKYWLCCFTDIIKTYYSVWATGCYECWIIVPLCIVGLIKDVSKLSELLCVLRAQSILVSLCLFSHPKSYRARLMRQKVVACHHEHSSDTTLRFCYQWRYSMLFAV